MTTYSSNYAYGSQPSGGFSAGNPQASGYPTGNPQASGYPTGNTQHSTTFSYGDKPTYGENFVLSARINFVRKVFSIVSVQLITTAFFIYWSAYSKGYMHYVRHSPFTTFLAIVGTISTSLVLTFWRSLARSAPINYYILGVFTLCESFLVSKLTLQYDPSAIFGAIFLTAAIVSALTLYACVTKHEITYFMGLIAMLSMGSFFLFFVRIIFHGSFMHLLTALIGASMAGLYLIYDIKAIMGNHGTFKVDIDDYVSGALNLYVDVIQIFIKVLHLFSEKEEEKKNRKRR